MNFLELASARHSCREYTEKKVEEEKLDLLIKAARLAPTAKNKQPYKKRKTTFTNQPQAG